MIGLINPGTKQTGKRSAGKPHAAFDVAGAGNVTMVAGMQSTAKAMESPPEPIVRAPALDPTREGVWVKSPRATRHSIRTEDGVAFGLIKPRIAWTFTPPVRSRPVATNVLFSLFR